MYFIFHINIDLVVDSNHIFFTPGTRLLIFRHLTILLVFPSCQIVRSTNYCKESNLVAYLPKPQSTRRIELHSQSGQVLPLLLGLLASRITTLHTITHELFLLHLTNIFNTLTINITFLFLQILFY